MRTSENHLETIIEADATADAARMALIGAVVRAKLGGTSWQEIAQALNISKQTAYNRYNGYVPEVSAAAAAALATAGPEACTCGCGLLESDCTTPMPEGPAKELTPGEEEREALAEWAIKNSVQAPADDAGQLAGQTTIEDAGHPVDDPARRDAFRAGYMDTAGKAMNWDAEPAYSCRHCSMPDHSHQRTVNGPKTFWFYPGCEPTEKDHAFRAMM